MRTTVRLTAVCAVAAILGGAFLTSADEQGHHHGLPEKAPQKRPAPIVGMHELMELFNQPLYRRLKQEMQQEPTDKKGWSTLKDRGIQAAEIINLVAIREMAEEHQKIWPELTRTAQQAALDLAHAAEAQNWQKTQSAYRALVQNCNDCHRKVAPEHAPMLTP